MDSIKLAHDMIYCSVFVNTTVPRRGSEMMRQFRQLQAASAEVIESWEQISECAPSGGFKTAALRDGIPGSSNRTLS